MGLRRVAKGHGHRVYEPEAYEAYMAAEIDEVIASAAAAGGAGEMTWRQTAVCRTEADAEAADVRPGVPQLGQRWYEKQATQAMEIEHRDEHTRDEGQLRAMVAKLGTPNEGLEGIMLYALVARRPGHDGGGAASGAQSQTQRGESTAADDEPHGAQGGTTSESERRAPAARRKASHGVNARRKAVREDGDRA